MYTIQKKRFSSIQSNYHKLLNTLKTNTQTNEQIKQIVLINETLDILEAQIQDFNEQNCNVTKEELENIEKNNNTIEFIKKFALLHRFLLD